MKRMVLSGGGKRNEIMCGGRPMGGSMSRTRLNRGEYPVPTVHRYLPEMRYMCAVEK